MSHRSLTFDLSGAPPPRATGYPRGNTQRALARYPVASVGAQTSAQGGGGRWSWPWAALPLAIHRLLNGGKSGIVDVSEQWFAVFIYETDRVTRIAMWIAGALLGAYIAAVGFPETVVTDAFTWVVLECIYIGIALAVVSSLVGRFTALDSFTVEEMAARSELRLPWLLLNYQSFGIERTDGVLAAAIVIFTHAIGAASWGLVLYVATARMFDQDAYRWVYAMVWSAFAATSVLNALSSSVSFADARDMTSKDSADLNSSESLRVNLIQLKVFWVLTVCFPLFIFFPLYAFESV